MAETPADARTLVTDPGRGNSAPFTRALIEQGYVVTEMRSPMNDEDAPPYRGRLLSYSRPAAMAAAQAVLS